MLISPTPEDYSDRDSGLGFFSPIIDTERDIDLRSLNEDAA